MSTQRAVAARQPAGPDRRPAPKATAAVRPAQVLQRRLGNQGSAAFVARAMRVSSPADAAEREAVSTAAVVMRSPAAPAVARSATADVNRCACEGGELQREAVGPGGVIAPPVSTEIQRAMAGGTPLPP